MEYKQTFLFHRRKDLFYSKIFFRHNGISCSIEIELKDELQEGCLDGTITWTISDKENISTGVMPELEIGKAAMEICKHLGVPEEESK